MRTMNTGGIEYLHSKSFTTPSLWSLISAIALILVISYPLGQFNQTLYTTVVSFSTLTVLRFVLKMHLNVRRILLYVLFTLVTILALNTISESLIGKNALVQIFTSFVAVSIFHFVSERKFAFTIALPFSMLITKDFRGYSLIGFALGLAYLLYLNRNIRGFNVSEYFKSFLLSWLSDDPQHFERVLEKNGRIFKGWVKRLNIGDLTLVTTSFHPGPMRNIGGSKLVGRVFSNNAVYLHSPTGHELNPVSGKDVEKIIATLQSIPKGKKLEPMKPFDIEGRKFLLRVFPFEDFRLMFVIGKECIDDLPYELNDFAGRFGESIVVDSHNAYCKRFKADVSELKYLIEKAFEIETEQTGLRYTFKSYRLETQTICGNVVVILLDYKDEKHAIVVIDGNNINIDFRKRLEGLCSEWGYKATIVTTDNHSKTGIQAKVGYKPVGFDERDEHLFDILEDCFKSAEFVDCDGVFFEKKKVDVKVVGKDFCLFVTDAGVFGSKALKIYFALLFLSALLSIFLVFQ